MSGQFVYIEIPAGDTAEAREFWGSLLGWQFRPAPGAGDYHTTQIGDQQGAAITGDGGGPRSYFVVDDINAGAARVKELGGTASDPSPIPSLGWLSKCADPHGNAFGLWEIDAAAPAPGA